MKILGALLCLISLFVLYKRFSLILLGKSAQGTIIGYNNGTRGTRGAVAYTYEVKYQYQNQEYIGYSLESTTASDTKVLDKNMNREVKVYFKESEPKVVTIREIKGTTISGLMFLALGIFTIVFF